MVPGKKYTPEDFVAIAWARRWFIIVPFVLISSGAIGYAMVQPNRYRAQTAIVVTPQQVPQNYVRSTVTTLLADRLQLIQQQILSRTRLERIIEEFNLYPEMRATRIMEDVVTPHRTGERDVDTKDIRLRLTPDCTLDQRIERTVLEEVDRARAAKDNEPQSVRRFFDVVRQTVGQ